MNKYTIYCTEEQTKKALELGAPLEYHCPNEREIVYHRPTAEQLIGWLEEQVDNIDIIRYNDRTWLYLFFPKNSSQYESEDKYQSRKEATLAAIDVALDYLSKNK